MGKQSRAYAQYLEAFKDNPKYDRIYDVSLAGAKRLNVSKKHDSGDGQPDGVFLMPDGSVIERKISCGWLSQYFKFNSLDEWKRYRSPMMSNVYFEF